MNQLEWRYKFFDELSLKELYDAMVIRQEVFAVEQDCAYLDADSKDFQANHLFAYSGEELVAYARVVYPGIVYKEVSIGRIVIGLKHRKKGYGKELVAQSIAYCAQQFGKVPIRISAQCYLIAFYESFGFQGVGEEYLEDGIPHLEMLRDNYEL